MADKASTVQNNYIKLAALPSSFGNDVDRLRRDNTRLREEIKAYQEEIDRRNGRASGELKALSAELSEKVEDRFYSSLTRGLWLAGMLILVATAGGFWKLLSDIIDFMVDYGDLRDSLAAYSGPRLSAQSLVDDNSADCLWQRELLVSHDRIGELLVSQGDGAGALVAYQAGLAIAEDLAKRDPANKQWQQRDLAVSCAKLGSLESLLPIQERREHLSRGLKIVTNLKQAGRLNVDQALKGWFEVSVQGLDIEFDQAADATRSVQTAPGRRKSPPRSQRNPFLVEV